MKCQFKLLGSNAFDAELKGDEKIEQVRELAAEKLSQPKESIRVVFKGRVCKDNQTIAEIGLSDGCTVHLVRAPSANNTKAEPEKASDETNKSASSTAANASSPVPPSDPFAALGGAAGLGGLQSNAMLESLLSNPRIVEQMMGLMSNTELVNQVMQNNQFLQSMAAQNPAILETLNNPELMRNVANMMRQFTPSSGAGQSSNANVDTAGIENFLNNVNPNMDFSSLLGGNGAGAAAASQNMTNEEAKEKYKNEINQLVDMGFLDTEENLQALKKTGGNIDAAINIMLGNN